MITEEAVAIQEAAEDHKSFEAFVIRYQTPMLWYLEKQLKDRNRAEDFMQETFMKLYHQLQEETPPDHVPAWLYRVAGNLCRDYWRSAGYKREKTVLDQFAADQRDDEFQPEKLCEQRERQMEMYLLLSELPKTQRKIVILRYYKGLKLKEIADQLNCPIGTVKSRLFHALRSLRDRIVEKGGLG